MGYSLKIAIKNLWHDKWINLLSVLTIATGLFILGFIIPLIFNIEKVTKAVPEKFTISIFLKNNITNLELKKLINNIKNRDIIKSIKYISKEKAFEDLKNSLKDSAYILEGIDENPLFPCIKIKLRREGFDKQKVETLIKELINIENIEDVIYGKKLLGTIYDLYKGVRIISGLIILLFCVAVIFVCYSTVKILFYRKKEEIEIYKLLGATKWFIRSPFIFEGSLLGLLGGILASVGVIGIFKFIKGFSDPLIPSLKFIVIPVELFFILPMAGLLLGIIGSTVAIGRIRY